MFVDRPVVARRTGQVPGDAPSPRGGPKNLRDIRTLDLAQIAPAGHYLALRIGFAFPMEEVNALPQNWIDLYNHRGMMIFDPVIRWVYDSEGQCRWSAVPFGDPRGVLATAREHGLQFGAAVSLRDEGPRGHRSFGNFARADREFTDEEMDLLLAYVRSRHEALSPPQNITDAEIEALRLIKAGQRLKQIAYQLGVTEGAVKQRLKNARIKLEAKTGAEAISRAAAFGLI